MDIGKLSLAELRDLDARIKDELARGNSKRRALAMEQIHAIAREVGMPLKSLLEGGDKGNGKSRRKPQRYEDPTNPSNTWGGAGPRPAWFKKAIAAGVALSALEAR